MNSRLWCVLCAGLLLLGSAVTAAAATIFSQTQTGAELFSNPNVSFPSVGGTQALNGSSLDVDASFSQPALKWDILPASARGDLVFTFTIDYTALTADNDPGFGIIEGLNDGDFFQGLARVDNSGGSYFTRSGAKNVGSNTFNANYFSTPHTGLGPVSTFTFVMNIFDFGGSATNISSITEGAFNTTSPLSLEAAHQVDTDNALSFVVLAGNAAEDYRINQISITVEDASAVVPIPAAAWLFGSGLLGLVGMARRRKA